MTQRSNDSDGSATPIGRERGGRLHSHRARVVLIRPADRVRCGHGHGRSGGDDLHEYDSVAPATTQLANPRTDAHGIGDMAAGRS